MANYILSAAITILVAITGYQFNRMDTLENRIYEQGNINSSVYATKVELKHSIESIDQRFSDFEKLFKYHNEALSEKIDQLIEFKK